MAHVSKADLMIALDVVGRAFHAMKSADAAWGTNPCEQTNLTQARARKAFKKAVHAREVMERRMWAQEAA